MQRFLSITILFGLAYLFLNESRYVNRFFNETTISDSAIAEAYESRTSNLQIGGSGEVIRILPDDTDGSRHQRFIVRLSSGQTLLIAHNIDLAPRVLPLNEGDQIEFFGEYEWNDQGGAIHWTHKDPQGQHVAGWLKHQGRTYH